jgi:forkhead box protein J2/3
MAQTPQGLQSMNPVQDGQNLDPTGYYPENDLTGGLPINLDSLRDGPPGSKPFYPYSTLIRYVVALLCLFAPRYVHI